MADLGSIGVQVSRTRGSVGRVYMDATLTKSVSGTCSVSGVATAGILVRVYAKNNGELLGQATADGSGNYTVKTGSVTDVYALFFNPTTYQMIGYDRITPG
jgi:hypothetical protein